MLSGMSAFRRALLLPAFLLLLVPAAVGPWLIGSTRTWALSLDLAAVFLGAALFLASRALLPAGRGAAAWRLPPAFPAFAAFVLYVGLRVPFAVAPFTAGGEALRALALLLLYAALWPLARETGAWRAILAALLLSAACMAMYALHQHLGHDTSVLWAERPAPYGLRASGAYLCPNHFANWLAMAAVSSLALSLLPAAGAAMRLSALYVLFLAVPGIYLSQSRSAVLGLFAAFAFLPVAVFGRESKTRFALAVLLVPLLAAGAGILSVRAVPALKTRFHDVLENPDRAGGARLRVWRDAVEMVKARPVAGVGPASFMWAYPPFRKNVANTFLWDYPHNEYVALAVEEGAAGATLFFAGGLWLFGWWAVRLARTRSRGAAAALAGAGGVVAASAVHAFFDFNIHIFPNPCSLVALFCALCAAADEADNVPSAGGGKAAAAVGRVAAGLLACAALAALVPVARRYVSYRETLRGRAAADMNRPGWAGWDGAHEAFARAQRACPGDPAPWLEDGTAWLGQAMLFVAPDAEARRAGKLERAETARKALERAVALNPADGGAKGMLARAEEMTGDAAAAERHLREWMAYDLSDGAAREALGMFLRRQGRKREALEVFEAAKEEGFWSKTMSANLRLLRRSVAAEEAAERVGAP